jgi:hypothetical protein
MADPVKIEDAPHYLKLLEEYGKAAITLSLALLSVSVAYANQFLKPPVELAQWISLLLLWLLLFLALLSGLIVIASLTAVSSNYMKALRIAFPDQLSVISEKGVVETTSGSQQKQLTAEQIGNMKASLAESNKRVVAAVNWANFSLWMFGLSSVLIIFLGIYSSVLHGSSIDASAAVSTSVKFVNQQFGIKDVDSKFSSLIYDETKKIYTVEITNAQAANETYEVTISAVSGNILSAKKSP